MKKSTFWKILFSFLAIVVVACAPNPVFAQRGGHGGGGGGFHGGGGGGFHGGGGGGHFSGGGGHFSGGGAPSGRPSMGRAPGPSYAGRPSGFAGRPSGASPFSSRSFQHGGGSVARPPSRAGFGGNGRTGSMARNSRPGASASRGSAAPAARADGQWHSFAGAAGGSSAARSAGHANFAWAHGGPAGGARAGTAARSSGMKASSPSMSNSAPSSAISPSHAVSSMQGSRMNSSALAGLRSSKPISGGSAFGNSSFSHTGLNNSAFRSARLGSNTQFNHSTFTRSTFGHPFGGRGFGHGFGRGFHDRDFDDFGFGFGCFGCGFGFGFGPGFGFGWGWGWGGWWNPWWWGPFWWEPQIAYYPWWGWPAPAPVAVPGDYSLYYGDSNSTYNAPYGNPSTGYGGSDSLSGSLNPGPVGSPNTNPITGNVTDSTPTVLLYLKDGTMLAASDYWIADNKLHYLVNYGGENTVETDQVDLQRTVDENEKRGVKFWLKPNPNRTTGSPAESPAPASAVPRETILETASELPAD
jgi:hypothetical protein